MGSCPPWYRVIQAARYLGMSPPDVARLPVSWVLAAEEAQEAEAIASAERKKAHGAHGA